MANNYREDRINNNDVPMDPALYCALVTAMPAPCIEKWLIHRGWRLFITPEFYQITDYSNSGAGGVVLVHMEDVGGYQSARSLALSEAVRRELFSPTGPEGG